MKFILKRSNLWRIVNGMECANNSTIDAADAIDENGSKLIGSTQNAFSVQASIPSNANLTKYVHCHEAVGHVDSVFRQKIFYEDGRILPDRTKYDCEACSLSKSFHHPPKSTTSRASKPPKRVYSNLSDKAPVALLGGSYYY